MPYFVFPHCANKRCHKLDRSENLLLHIPCWHTVSVSHILSIRAIIFVRIQFFVVPTYHLFCDNFFIRLEMTYPLADNAHRCRLFWQDRLCEQILASFLRLLRSLSFFWLKLPESSFVELAKFRKARFVVQKQKLLYKTGRRVLVIFSFTTAINFA